MDRDTTGIVPAKGMTVVGSDGMRVGEIDVVESTYLVVRAGGLFPQDHFIPIADIVAQDADGALRLSMPADEALERTLGNPAAAGSADIPASSPVAQRRDDDMHRTIPVVEEELDVHVRTVERGAVRVEKQIVEEQQTIEVPLVEEEVEVTRRRVDREIRDDDHAFEERSIEIPLRGQAVEIEKPARVVEEIDIDKTARTRTEQVNETVRKESARVVGDAVEDPGPAGDDEDDVEAR